MRVTRWSLRHDVCGLGPWDTVIGNSWREVASHWQRARHTDSYRERHSIGTNTATTPSFPTNSSNHPFLYLLFCIYTEIDRRTHIYIHIYTESSFTSCSGTCIMALDFRNSSHNLRWLPGARDKKKVLCVHPKDTKLFRGRREDIAALHRYFIDYICRVCR